jgi:hypothetical protein
MSTSKNLLLLAGLLFQCACASTHKSSHPRILNYNYTQPGKGVAASGLYTMPPVCKNVVRSGSHPKM